MNDPTLGNDACGAAVQEPCQPLLDAITFDDRGLVAVVAQQHDTGEVLMVAWMNREAVAESVRTGRVCYWSRSRARLWRKGRARAKCSAWSSSA